MKTKEEIEKLAAREYWNSNTESRSFIKGYTQCQEDICKEKESQNTNYWSDEDMLKIAEYAYKFRATHQFFENKLIDSCKQYMEYLKTLKL